MILIKLSNTCFHTARYVVVLLGTCAGEWTEQLRGQDFEILRCKRERAYRKNSIIIFRSTKCGDNTRLPYFGEVWQHRMLLLDNNKLLYSILLILCLYSWIIQQMAWRDRLNFWRRNYFFLNFSTSCIWNVNNTGTKYVRIMKQTAFWRERNRDYIPCLKYSVPIFVE